MTSFGMAERIQKSMADKFMRMVIENHLRVKAKKGIYPTADQVMQEINKKTFDVLLQHGYTEEGIKAVVEDIIGRRK